MNLRGDRHRAERGVEMVRTCEIGWDEWLVGEEWLERWGVLLGRVWQGFRGGKW